VTAPAPRQFVLTGGPGVGKTTLVGCLSRLGFGMVRETARDVIVEQRSRDGESLPWRDRTAFQLLVLEQQLIRENRATSSIVFCDRGIPDGIAYLRIAGLPVPKPIAENARDRYELVFLLEPVGEVPADGVRYEDPETAARVHALIFEVYTELGYSVVRIPALPIAARAEILIRSTLPSI
jgi:predicted ATPase